MEPPPRVWPSLGTPLPECGPPRGPPSQSVALPTSQPQSTTSHTLLTVFLSFVYATSSLNLLPKCHSLFDMWPHMTS